MFRRFKKRFEYVNEDDQKITIPRNWAGEVTESVAKKADAAGATLVDKVKKSKSEEPAGGKPLVKMTKDELVAYAGTNNITIDPTKTNAEIVATIEAAEKVS
jgi:tRNA(Ile)-lysidine synthase TilS/MesJ